MDFFKEKNCSVWCTIGLLLCLWAHTFGQCRHQYQTWSCFQRNSEHQVETTLPCLWEKCGHWNFQLCLFLSITSPSVQNSHWTPITFFWHQKKYYNLAFCNKRTKDKILALCDLMHRQSKLRKLFRVFHMVATGTFGRILRYMLSWDLTTIFKCSNLLNLPTVHLFIMGKDFLCVIALKT